MKQTLRTLRDDDSAVSPVIGVILMVAITVILAAVIGTFVLGLGDSLQQAPQSSLNAEDASTGFNSTAGQDAFTISQDGGDAIPFADMRIVVDGDSVDAQFEQGAWTDDAANLTVSTSGEEFAVGDSLTISEVDGESSSLSANTEYRIRLIHVPSDSILLDQEVTLR